MSAGNTSSGNGIGVTGILLCIFVTLKLLHKIDWSWWWVLSPVWIPLAVVAAIILPIVMTKVFK